MIKKIISIASAMKLHTSSMPHVIRYIRLANLWSAVICTVVQKIHEAILAYL